MKIKARTSHFSYTDEEKYAFYVEGKIRGSKLSENKKKYSKNQRLKAKQELRKYYI